MIFGVENNERTKKTINFENGVVLVIGPVKVNLTLYEFADCLIFSLGTIHRHLKKLRIY